MFPEIKNWEDQTIVYDSFGRDRRDSLRHETICDRRHDKIEVFKTRVTIAG
jgi:hypothetical protein